MGCLPVGSFAANAGGVNDGRGLVVHVATNPFFGPLMGQQPRDASHLPQWRYSKSLIETRDVGEGGPRAGVGPVGFPPFNPADIRANASAHICHAMDKAGAQLTRAISHGPARPFPPYQPLLAGAGRQHGKR